MYVADIYTVNTLDIIIYQAEGSIWDIWEKKKKRLWQMTFNKWHTNIKWLILISELVMSKKICLCLQLNWENLGDSVILTMACDFWKKKLGFLVGQRPIILPQYALCLVWLLAEEKLILLVGAFLFSQPFILKKWRQKN